MSPLSDLPVARALISVFDKRGLIPFAQALAAGGVEILSTGGSALVLKEAGIPVIDVAAATAFPEMLDGRVKTLHPAIHGGLLARRDDPAHMEAIAGHGIKPIDLLVSNLYPFEATIARGAGFDECIENIDIGGPALIRAAAKNHDFVTVVTDPADYERVTAELTARGGRTSLALRRELAGLAYARTARYDSMISAWFAGQRGETFPPVLTVGGVRGQLLRYGENPHQEAALYIGGEARFGVATARQLQGKELSYNNLNDTDAAFELVSEFEAPACAIIKHANPCGVAEGATLAEAYRKALACDPVSAYGGIIAVNRMLDLETADALARLFVEVVIAPEVAPEAAARLAAKTDLRLLAAGGVPDPAASGLTFRSLAGGFLAQTRDAGRVGAADLTTVTKRAPTAAEIGDLLFAFRVVKHVKSNAVVFARNRATIGIGAGQMSRVDSARIAVSKAMQAAPGTLTDSVVASDAFYPFPDALIVAAEAGATATIHPGGSKRDAEVIAAADERGLAMVMTGMRHFRH